MHNKSSSDEFLESVSTEFSSNGRKSPCFQPFCDGNDAWESTTSKPCAFTYYLNELEQYANSGANYFKLVNSPWATDVEFEKINDYSDRLHLAWEVDRILDKTKELDLKLHFNMCLQFVLENPSVYSMYSWDWDTADWGIPNCVHGTPGYCYNTDLGLTDPVEFLTDPNAIKFYQYRLRYMIARYGYSTSISVFELFSEINNIGTVTPAQYYPDDPNTPWNDEGCASSNNTIYKPYVNNASVPAKIAYWYNEMARYIKQDLQHGEHILAVGYTGEPNINAGDNSYYSSYIDLPTFNHYTLALNRGISFIEMVEKYSSGSLNTNKPLMFTESGAPDYEECGQYAEWIKTAWTSPFSGSAGIALNWGGKHNTAIWPHYGRIRDFISGIDFDYENWYSEHDPSDEHDLGIKEDGEFVAEIVCLRKPGGNNNNHKAIGVLLNRTYNYWTHSFSGTSPCRDGNEPDPPFNILFNVLEFGNWPDWQKPYLKNVGIKKKYRLDFYSVQTGNLIASVTKRSNSLGHLHFDYPYDLTASFNSEENAPIIAFKIYRSNDTFLSQSFENDVELLTVEDESHDILATNNLFQSEIKELELTVQPNPADEKININAGEWARNATLFLFNQLGEVILKKELIVLNLSIDVSQIPAGFYYISIEKNSIRKSEKIIIN